MHGYTESGPVFNALRNGGLAAAIYHMTDHQLSSSIILALMELCVAKNFSNYSGVYLMCERDEKERDRGRETEGGGMGGGGGEKRKRKERCVHTSNRKRVKRNNLQEMKRYTCTKVLVQRSMM